MSTLSQQIADQVKAEKAAAAKVKATKKAKKTTKKDDPDLDTPSL